MIWKFSNLHGAIAQLGERIVRNDEVVGSIPTSSTIKYLKTKASTTSIPELTLTNLTVPRRLKPWYLAAVYANRTIIVQCLRLIRAASGVWSTCFAFILRHYADL
jgi:hypothetical protein